MISLSIKARSVSRRSCMAWSSLAFRLLFGNCAAMARSNSEYVTARLLTVAATFEDTGRLQLATNKMSTLEAATEMCRPPLRLLGLFNNNNALCFRFLDFFYEGRNDLEQIAYRAVIRGFENRRVLVFIDRHNGFRAFHADQVLNRSGNTDGDVHLGRYGLTGASNLALHRQPPVVTDRT